MKVMITGASGMLAQNIIPQLRQQGFDTVLSARAKDKGTKHIFQHVDITNEEAILRCLDKHRPHWIINCAAFTNVDAAEKNESLAFRVNAEGTEKLAKSAKECGVNLLHISTDYVFGGLGVEESVPFCEYDHPSPVGVYGRSKYEGELRIQSIIPKQSIILRTSLVHGPIGANFVSKILQKATQAFEVVDDQVGSPTWTGFLGEVICRLLKEKESGIFHVSSSECVSRFDFARAILDQFGYAAYVSACSTYPKGIRPAFSALSCPRLIERTGIHPISWREGLRRHFLALHDEDVIVHQKTQNDSEVRT